MKLTIPEDKRFNIPECTYECSLVDDGTLDTVIEIDGTEHRFDGEFANQYRDKNGTMTEKGFIELCKECIEECDEHWK
tara:strand:+ start:147 stop:380 length:234 start_codon:yes stop_codon:yes gene_type:complete